MAKTMAKKRQPKAYDMKTFTKCFFCGGEIVDKYSGLRDRFDTTQETFSVSECLDCKAGFINPMPTGDVSQFYPTNYLSGESEAETGKGDSFDFETWYRYNQYDYDFKLLKRASGKALKDAASYVDIGCGSGERVTYAKDRGVNTAYGVDKFDFAKSQSKEEVTIINSEILAYKPKQKFEVASLFHVLEHVENPDEILAHIRAHIIDKKGYLIVQVPNYGSFERRFFKSKWFSFDVPRHIWQFNEKALVDMLQRAGYKIDGTYQSNAPLHPVTIVPSIHRELDIQRIWVKGANKKGYKQAMTLLWAGLTLVTIPVTMLQNAFRRSSMLTVVASSKK